MLNKEDYMRRAIELAKLGEGKVNPNPLVGAVIVKDDVIIGEGYHMQYGGLHAERNAFASIENKELAKGAEMYVTLEPCCHQGKQPPCTEAIIEHGISKVYVGSDDPNELVAGKGIEILRNAGIEVETGFLKEECDELNPVFFHYITTGMPYVVMKYAMTLDGKIATRIGHSRWISGEESRNKVQHTRNALSAIMVGIGTVLADDPMLSCRLEDGRNPIRVICDSKLRIPLSSKIVSTANDIPTIVATILPHEEYQKFWNEQREVLVKEGVEVLIVEELNGQLNLFDLMRKLGRREIDSVLLEGGSTLNYTALKEGVVSEIQVYVAPKLFGGVGLYTPVGGEGVELATQAFDCKLVSSEQIGEDILLKYRMI